MDDRDELIKELQAFEFSGCSTSEGDEAECFNGRVYLDEITENYLADFILRREEALLAEIEKPLKKEYDFSGKTDMWKVAQEQSDAIDEALQIIEKARGK